MSQKATRPTAKAGSRTDGMLLAVCWYYSRLRAWFQWHAGRRVDLGVESRIRPHDHGARRAGDGETQPHTHHAVCFRRRTTRAPARGPSFDTPLCRLICCSLPRCYSYYLCGETCMHDCTFCNQDAGTMRACRLFFFFLIRPAAAGLLDGVECPPFWAACFRI